jgi:uncharacterized protein (DUF1015 family)
MAVFVPFKAFRPSKEQVTLVASKPYDVLNEKEAREECAGNPNSFYHVIKPEIDFPDGYDLYAPEIYEKGKENFEKLVRDDVLMQDPKESLYVYELEMNGRSQTGFVGCCAIDDYFNNVIKKHELTRPDKEEDRKNHIRVSKLNNEAVFLTYRHIDEITEIMENAKKQDPAFDFTLADGIRHRIWVLDEPSTVREISNLFDAKVENIYIADGHHRTAAAALVGKEIRDTRGDNGLNGLRNNYFMAAMFPDNQVRIYDYNRLISDLNGLSPDAFIQQLKTSFEVETRSAAYKPESIHTFGMYLEGEWYKLTAKEGTFDEEDPLDQLDVSILSNHVLVPLLNVVDLRRDKRIDFVGGRRGLAELVKRVDSGEMRVAFALFPLDMQQLINISDNDQIMPPKVTWFEPKLRSGLFVHSLEN